MYIYTYLNRADRRERSAEGTLRLVQKKYVKKNMYVYIHIPSCRADRREGSARRVKKILQIKNKINMCTYIYPHAAQTDARALQGVYKKYTSKRNCMHIPSCRADRREGSARSAKEKYLK
jgi:hypothetical protein